MNTERIEKQLNEIKETLEWEEANKDKIKAELSGKTETKPKPRPHKALQLSAFDLNELTLEGIEEIKKELEKDGLDFYSMSTIAHDGLTDEEEANEELLPKLSASNLI